MDILHKLMSRIVSEIYMNNAAKRCKPPVFIDVADFSLITSQAQIKVLGLMDICLPDARTYPHAPAKTHAHTDSRVQSFPLYLAKRLY